VIASNEAGTPSPTDIYVVCALRIINAGMIALQSEERRREMAFDRSSNGATQ
jgi:hypothetical protein